MAATLAVPLVGGPSGGLAGADAASPGHARTRAETTMAAAMLSELNKERAAHHLPALRSDPRLQTAARTHDAAMAKAQQLSHQLRGEATFGQRISRAGYAWRNAAENVGVSAPPSTAAVLAVQRAMYDETGANAPHRTNILNRTYLDVGIDVYTDPAHHRVWITQDYGRR